ncbi:hypothetical protein OF83DRAFT_1161602 [Amylostereum chailletii]|nr:hypothetical protein OF83DRAFT_1161602 [Amylostereum chailletii]
MPRLIERLLKSLSKNPPAAKPLYKTRRIARGRRSLRNQLPVLPSHSAHSVLLDLNPIANPSQFVHHKSLPPHVFLHPNQHKNTISRDGTVEPDAPREMSALERDQWANPYLRMLASPIRRCLVTERYLPTDFLVRVAARRIPSSRITTKRERYVLLPDGLEHPKYCSLRSRRGNYILCRNSVISELTSRPSSWKHRTPPYTTISPSLAPHIAHLLRLRVLQELELLCDRLKTRSHNAVEAPLLRRLTRAEFSEFRKNDSLPHLDAVAILVVPPLNRDPTTRTRPAPNTTALPDAPDATADLRPPPKRPPPPVSTLHLLGSKEIESDGLPGTVSPAQVPLYNGVSLFPSRSQRVALHQRLTQLLSIERRARKKETDLTAKTSPSSPPRGDEKASHAFVLYSSGTTAQRSDSVPLAIALWRLRMWEGSPWKEGSGTWASVV